MIKSSIAVSGRGVRGSAIRSTLPAAQLWIAHGSLAVLLYVGALYLYLAQPLWYLVLVDEDNLGEYLTVTLYIAAAILLAVHVVSRGGRCIGHCILIACFVFMAGEEISWGQRIFHFGTPVSWAALNYQRELSLHNVVRINSYLPLLASAVVLWAAMTPWLPRYAWYRRLDAAVGIPAPKGHQFPLFLVAAHCLDSKPFFQGAELGELLLAFAFVVHVASWRGGRRHSRVMMSIVLAAAVASATALTIGHPLDSLYRTHKLAANYAHNKLCSQAATVYEQLRHTTRPARSVFYSAHHATVQYARILRYASAENEASSVMDRWLTLLQSLPDAASDPVRLEQIGDALLHLGKSEQAGESYSRALAMHRRRVLTTGASVGTKFHAYYSSTNIRAKLGDLVRADAAYVEVQKLALDSALTKRLKNRLRDYRDVKKHGVYPLVLMPTKRETWGSFGSSPVGECKLSSR